MLTQTVNLYSEVELRGGGEYTTNKVKTYISRQYATTRTNSDRNFAPKMYNLLPNTIRTTTNLKTIQAALPYALY